MHGSSENGMNVMGDGGVENQLKFICIMNTQKQIIEHFTLELLKIDF